MTLLYSNADNEWEDCNGYAIAQDRDAADQQPESLIWRMNANEWSGAAMRAHARGLTMSKH
jgi:hypothetical protein